MHLKYVNDGAPSGDYARFVVLGHHVTRLSACAPLWMRAAKNEARMKMFDRLSEARMKLCGLARVAIGRALGDLRAYHFDAEKEMLSPPSKKRFCPTTTQDSSAHEQANEAEHDKDEAIESVQSI